MGWTGTSLPGWFAQRARSYPRLRAAVRWIKRARRRSFERLGFDRYSHPSYDQLDRKLSSYLPERGGVFVEAGAFDGYWASNTYWFERFRGWTGVLIEPLPELAKRARLERPASQVFQCALVPPEFEGDRVPLQYGGIMSVVRTAWEGSDRHADAGARMEGVDSYAIDVPARRLSDVLDEAGLTQIDLLTLDVEGWEADVLRGLDLARHAPRFLLVEMLRESDQRAAIERTLGSRYRYEARLSSCDHLYRRD